jgi:hypothetical protein
MNEFFTIYFDTQFYVKLANTDETLANKTIDALNNLQVRPVLSQPIILELLKKSSKPDKDKILVERINRFNISSYVAKSLISGNESSLSWDILLLDGQEREFLSKFLILVKDLWTEAESMTIAIPRNSKQKEKLSETSLDKLEKLEVLENRDNFKNNDFEEVFKTASNILNQIILPVNSIFPSEVLSKTKEVEFDKEVNEESASNFAQRLFDVIGIENRENLESHNELKKSITKNEDRPFKVAVDEASKGEVMKLGNTLGDTEHMSLFAINKNEIDLLQIDIPQFKILKNNPSHKLIEMGLDCRCFTAKSLEETVEKVANLKEIFQR